MKKSLLFFLVAAISFIGGFTLHSSTQANVSSSNHASPSPTPLSSPKEDEFPKLVEDKYITKFNGKRLDLDYDGAFISDDLPSAIDAAKVTAMADGGLIISIGDSLARFTAQQKAIWRNPLGMPIIDYAYVDSTNRIYVTAGDNNMFVIDGANGKVLTGEGRNGSAWYGVAEKYGNDMALVTDDFRWYRERNWQLNMDPVKDGITCWRGTNKLWHLDFPPDAQLVVSGKRILAVTKSKKAIYVQEIIPPQTKSE